MNLLLFNTNVFVLMFIGAGFFSCHGMNDAFAIFKKQFTEQQALFCDKILKDISENSVKYDYFTDSYFLYRWQIIKNHIQCLQKINQVKKSLKTKDINEHILMISNHIQRETKYRDSQWEVLNDIHKKLQIAEARELFGESNERLILVWYTGYVQEYIKKNIDHTINISHYCYIIGLRSWVSENIRLTEKYIDALSTVSEALKKTI